MRKTCMAIVGVLACAANPLCADGFSESDRALIAGSEVNPLPTEIKNDSNVDSRAPAQMQYVEKEMDIQPTHCSDNPITMDDVQPEDWNTPLGGKDVPPEE